MLLPVVCISAKRTALRRQYPRDMQLERVWDGGGGTSGSAAEHFRRIYAATWIYDERYAWRYRYLSVAALADGDRLAFQRAGVSAGSLGDVSDLRNLAGDPSFRL